MVKGKEKGIGKRMGQGMVEGKGDRAKLMEGVMNGKEKGEIYRGRDWGKVKKRGKRKEERGGEKGGGGKGMGKRNGMEKGKGTVKMKTRRKVKK